MVDLFFIRWVSPRIFVGAGHALRVHDVFIFYLCWVSTGFFVGAGHALRVHGGFIFYSSFRLSKLNSFLAIIIIKKQLAKQTNH
jgi:hypothetical protein